MAQYHQRLIVVVKMSVYAASRVVLFITASPRTLLSPSSDFCYNTQRQPPHLSNTGVAVCVVYINNVYVRRERVQMLNLRQCTMIVVQKTWLISPIYTIFAVEKIETGKILLPNVTH